MYKLDVSEFSYSNFFIILAIGITLGIILAFTYAFSNRKKGYDTSFMIALILLPSIVSAVVELVGTNVYSGLAIAGVFALVRFRANIKSLKDMIYIFLSIASGLANGVGYFIYALLITAILCIVLICISFTVLENGKENVKKLKISIPESLNYSHLFDYVFRKYLTGYSLSKVKTTDFGTMFELTYIIQAKDNFDEKAFIDELRVLNGNLNISLSSNYVNAIEDIPQNND